MGRSAPRDFRHWVRRWVLPGFSYPPIADSPGPGWRELAAIPPAYLTPLEVWNDGL
jgi:hypothetical protein